MTKQEKQTVLKAYRVINKGNSHIELEDVERFYKALIKDIKNRNIIVHIDVSKSGMSRKAGFYKHNLIINAIYAEKYSVEAVKIYGCGMDMIWHVLFYCTGNNDKMKSLCSDYHTI